MRSAYHLLAAVLLATTAHAQEASPPQSKQAIYNSAQAAFDKEDWETAAKGFASIAAEPSEQPLSYAQAIIRSHLATCYLKLVKLKEAVYSGKLAAVNLDGQAGEDPVDVWLTLADALRFNLDMEAAADAYAKALMQPASLNDDTVKIRAETGIALAYMVFDPAKAAAHADIVLTNQTLMKSVDKKQLAQVEAIRGMAEANMGNPKKAETFLRDAVSHSGGLASSKVSILQVGIRGDAAIVFQLLHDDENTRKYLTYTGAGHLKNENWTNGSNVEPPICGGAGNIKPDDTAVVQFSIDDLGKVISAVPIFANRPGEMGVEFARTVQEWRWRPDAVAKLEPFWRTSIRMQMRCITRPKGSQLRDSFYRSTINWLNSKNLSTGTFKAVLDGMALTKTEPPLQKDATLSLQILVDRWARAVHDGVEHHELSALLNKALLETDAPSDVFAFLIIEDNGSLGHAFRYNASKSAKYLRAALARFEMQWPHTRAASWLRTEFAIALERSGDFKTAKPELEHIIAEPEVVLADDDAIRRLATLHLAALKQHDGDAVGAKALIANAGITDQQCSLMDVRPVVSNNAFASAMFPEEALRWGFTGYVRTAFDIAADGRVRNTRAVLAYPPFVFDDAAEKTIARFRYLPPSIDGTALGCNGQSISIVYQRAR